MKGVLKLKEREKQNNMIRERREDEMNNANESQKNNKPLPQAKDFEEIEY